MFHYGVEQSLSTLQVNDVVTSYIFNRGYNFVVVAYEDTADLRIDVSVLSFILR